MTLISRPASSQRRKIQAGMTLIEVMIAVALLAFVAIFIYTATSRSFDVNRRLSAESNDYMNLAVAMQAFEKDVSQIYSPIVPLKKNAPPVTGNPPFFWSLPLRPDGLRRSRLTGARERITFLSSGNRRITQDAAESDFLKITWEIEKNSNNLYTLYRNADADAFNVNDSGGFETKNTRVAVLENLSSGRFSFYRASVDAWEDTWDSENQYAKPESRFPNLISLKIEVPDPLNPARSIPWETIGKPVLTLNEPAQTPANPNSGSGSGGGS